MSELCVCLSLGFSAESRKERRRESVDRMVAWKYEILHGEPKYNKEVASGKSTLLICLVGPRRGERKGRILGFLCLSPYYYLIM